MNLRSRRRRPTRCSRARCFPCASGPASPARWPDHPLEQQLEQPRLVEVELARRVGLGGLAGRHQLDRITTPGLGEADPLAAFNDDQFAFGEGGEMFVADAVAAESTMRLSSVTLRPSPALNADRML